MHGSCCECVVNSVLKGGIALMVFAIGYGVAFTAKGSPADRGLACGHRKRLEHRVGIWIPIPRASHCCQSGRIVNDFKKGGVAQEIYKNEHGRFAVNMDELNKELGYALRMSAGCQFKSDGTNWSVIVPRADVCAGNYLLDGSGDIYFNEARIPTTNDLVLNPRRK